MHQPQPNSQQWKELQRKFEALSDKGDLSASFSYAAESEINWSYLDAGRKIVAEFKDIAGQAGILLGQSDPGLACDAWLNALLSDIRKVDPHRRSEDPSISCEGESIEWIGQGPARPRQGDNDPNYRRSYTGMIERLAYASAVLCAELALQAPNSERAGREQIDDDPKTIILEITVPRGARPTKEDRKPTPTEQIIIDAINESARGIPKWESLCALLDINKAQPRKSWSDDKCPWPGTWAKAFGARNARVRSHWRRKMTTWVQNIKRDFSHLIKTHKITKSPR
jgi:hypothetical protein